jgi:hypothetical protein
MKMSNKDTVLWTILMLTHAAVGAAWGVSSETNEPATKIVLFELTIGRILHVNTNYNYVILQCGSLPSPEEEAKVCRGDAVVARLKLSESDRLTRFPFVAADVIEGQPRQGDTVKQVMKKYERAPSGGRKE